MASQQAYAVISGLGMDEKIGFVHTDTLSQNVSKQMFLARVEERVSHWLKEATARAERLIAEHWDQVKGLAELLIRQEIVDGAELVRIMAEKPGAGEGGAHG